MAIEGGQSASLTSTPGVSDLTVSESADAETKTTLQVLIEARHLIENEENWCRTVYRRGGACCALGAVYSALGLDHWEVHVPPPAEIALEQEMDGLFVGTFNDTHTHAEVLAAFDRAIAAERAKEGAR